MDVVAYYHHFGKEVIVDLITLLPNPRPSNMSALDRLPGEEVFVFVTESAGHRMMIATQHGIEKGINIELHNKIVEFVSNKKRLTLVTDVNKGHYRQINNDLHDFI